MKNIDWNDVIVITHILIAIGAFAGEIPICYIILIGEIVLLACIGIPIFIFFLVKALLGFEIAICVAILFVAFIAYSIYEDRQWKKYFKDHG